MQITVDIKHLSEVLIKSFPDLEETKLKSALFDLILDLEGNRTVATRTKVTTVAPVRDVERTVVTNNESSAVEEPEEEIEEVPVAAAATPGFDPFVDDSSWSSLAKSAGKKFEVEDAFELDEGPAKAPTLTAPPKVSAQPPRRKERKKNPLTEFEGMTDLEIARALTEQQFNGQERQDGQFVNLGTDGGSSEDIVF